MIDDLPNKKEDDGMGVGNARHSSYPSSAIEINLSRVKTEDRSQELVQPLQVVIMAPLGLIVSSIVTILLAGSIHIFHDSINLYFMGFFRDLARIKARKRRMQNSMAVSSTTTNTGFTKNDLKMLFLGKEEEDPLIDIDIHFDINSSNGEIKVIKEQKRNGDDPAGSSSTMSDEDLVEYTREELFEYGSGDNEEGILLLSLFGRVYDVSEGWKYYGEGGKYSRFAGRDVTRALSTGCMAESCLGSKHTPSSERNDDDYFELSPKTITEGKKWISFFETHDKYHLVGLLKDGRSMDDLIDEHLDQEEFVE